jgi:hypothetical protein
MLVAFMCIGCEGNAVKTDDYESNHTIKALSKEYRATGNYYALFLFQKIS